MVHIRKAKETDRNNVALCIAEVLAISDCTGRAARVEKASLKRHFGFLKGMFGAFVLKEEFEGQLEYLITTGYIEFVTVRKKYRKQGIATTMLQESMLLTNYQDFVLDVTDINNNAIKCYTNIGFDEFKRIPQKHGKQKGFNEKIFMRYRRK